jgi:thiol:disulfide interchange protein DsbC
MQSFLRTSAAVLLSLPLSVASADEDKVTESLHKYFPDLEITRIRESGIQGLYEVMIGTDVVYASHDGRYLIQGELLDLEARANLSEESRAAARLKLLEKIPAQETIEFAPENPRYTVYVFTDITCGYCRRLHRDMPELNRRGIAVRYLAFPREGEDSPAFRDMQSVWCASDRQAAITSAKAGKPVERRTCNNPVAKQFHLGQELGVTGTPAIFRADGRMLQGYMPPDDLLQALKEK